MASCAERVLTSARKTGKNNAAMLGENFVDLDKLPNAVIRSGLLFSIFSNNELGNCIPNTSDNAELNFQFRCALALSVPAIFNS